jgi:hypothetical protein
VNCTGCGKERLSPKTLAYIEAALRERMQRDIEWLTDHVKAELGNTVAEIAVYLQHVVANAKAAAPVDPLLL